MYLGNRLLRWLVIFFYFIINYAGKQNQFVLYYIMRTCFFTHHMHLFAIVNWVACSSLMGYLVHRYIVSISVRQRIPLTVREFNLLYKLLSYPKKTFTRSQLMDEFWEGDTSSGPRAVDVYMTKLRSKFSECQEFEIVTVHGLGYKAVLK